MILQKVQWIVISPAKRIAMNTKHFCLFKNSMELASISDNNSNRDFSAFTACGADIAISSSPVQANCLLSFVTQSKCFLRSVLVRKEACSSKTIKKQGVRICIHVLYLQGRVLLWYLEDPP